MSRIAASIAPVAVCLTVLAACHKAPEKPVAAAPPPAPVAVPARPSVPLPPRQPGLWETQVSEEGSAGGIQTLQICIDAETEPHLGILGTDLSGDSCARKMTSFEGDNTWGLLAECSLVDGITTEYSGSVTVEDGKTYGLKVRAQTTGGNGLNRVTNYVVTSKRLGACQADQVPGDLINNGVKMNLFDMSGVKRKTAPQTPEPSDDIE